VAFTPNTKTVLTGGADNLIREWYLDNGEQLSP